MAAALILVTGPPASGKSTLAARLAARYGWLPLAKDTIKESLFAVLGTGDAAWSRALSDASFALQFALAGPLLERGASVMLEGNFRPGEHEAPIGRLLARHAAACAQILVTADAMLRAARLAERARAGARHPGHRDAELAVQAAGGPAAADAGSAALALSGARFEVAGDGGAADFEALCRQLDRWWSAAPTSP